MRFPFKLSALALPAVLACTSSTPDQTITTPTWGVPITGGTMLVVGAGATARAVIADPDRDRIVIVNLSDGKILGNTALSPNDEPGRLVEGANGQVHVALRRGGAIVTIDSNGAILSRRDVCAEPRGLAYDATNDHLFVACSTGELVTFNGSGGDAIRKVQLERDLRDVVYNETTGGLTITKFRSAEILNVLADGTIGTRTKLQTVFRFGNGGPIGGGDLPPNTGGGAGSANPDGTVNAIPTVAWRMIKTDKGLVVSHQRQVQGELQTTQDGYGGGGCTQQGPVEAGLSVIHEDGTTTSVRPIASGSLPVDLAQSTDHSVIAVLTAGNQGVTIIQTSQLDQHDDNDPCGGGGDNGNHDNLGAPTSVGFSTGGTTAAGGTSPGSLVTYYPEVPAIVIRANNGADAPRVVKIPGELGYDSGRNVFHTQTKSGLACASCHPEGRDDGQIWTFAQFGTRRTQNLAGGILQRAPYHWTGDKPDLDNLMNDVFAVRMGGGTPTDGQKLAIGPWIDRLPAPKPLAGVDPDRAARGKALFESNTVQCTKCHNDALMTNNTLQDVGTGGAFKVPSLLGVSARAPFMHNGCATSLADRFSLACGGGDKHGLTSQLTPAQIDDLVGYLESL